MLWQEEHAYVMFVLSWHHSVIDSTKDNLFSSKIKYKGFSVSLTEIHCKSY